MKKSAEILGLPIISITEGRELGMSKTLVIDAKNGQVAAITIEDADWYRGVKLIPYESVIAIGDDAVTITNSENILTLDAASDYEYLLDENIRVIGTKAITKSGTIQGEISDVYIGDDGTIERCEITAHDGSISEVDRSQISIFGKEVTVIDPDGENGEKKTVKPRVAPTPAAAPVQAAPPAPAAPAAPAAQAAPAPAAAATPVAPAPAPKAPEKAEPPKAAAAPAAPKAAPAPKAAAPAPKVTAPATPAAPAAAPKAAPVAPAAAQAAVNAQKAAADKASEERHRRFLLGKKAARTIKMDNGIVIVNEGQDITEEVLQKAKLANKFIELSMNVQ